MKTLLYGTVFVFTLVATSSASDNFMTKFEEIKATGDDRKIQGFLETTEDAQKNNAEYYVLSANYWWALSQKIVISTKAPEAGDWSLRDADTGKVAGSISQSGKLFPEISQKAIDMLTKGAKLFPYRADIGMGLAYVQRELGKYDDCVTTLETLIKTAGTNPENIKWKNGNKHPKKVSEFMPEFIQDYSAFYYNRATDEDHKRCERLGKATITSFPDHPVAYNMLAALAIARNQNNEALGYLLTAYKKAPDDPIIILNLGDTYAKMGQKRQAKDYYNKVINAAFEEQYKKIAGQKLSQMNQ